MTRQGMIRGVLVVLGLASILALLPGKAEAQRRRSRGNRGGSPSYYYAPSTSGNQAQIVVNVPTNNAQVWLGDSQTKQIGMERVFISPPLEPGYTYTYQIRARWRQNGQDMEQTQRVRVQPGQTTVVNFPKGSATPVGE